MKSRTRKKSTPMLVEELEPRILYSADAAALVNPAALSPSAEIRALDVDAMPAPLADSGATQAAANLAAGTTPGETALQADAKTGTQAQRHEIVFVDTSVSGYEQLLADLTRDPARSVQTVLIDASRDGVAQISQALAGQHDIDAIHIISHGADGALELGSTMLGFRGLLANATAIRGWGDALTADADILLYGCDVAQDADGRAFVDAIGRLTGADVEASTNPTGSAALGGDWDLEYHAGLIEAGTLNAQNAGGWSGLLGSVASGGETQANTTIANNQTEAAVAMDASGNFVVVYTADGNQDGSGKGVYAQRFDASGAKVGAEFRVNTAAGDDQRSAAVAMDASGNFVVVWQSNLQDGAVLGVYGQRYNASGVAQGAEFRVNVTTAGNQQTPVVAMDSSGNFVVAWTSDQGGTNDIYARRYDAAGNALSLEFRVNTDTLLSQDLPTIGMNASGAFVIAWKNTNPADGSGTGVFAQRYNAFGFAQGSEFQVNTTASGAQDKPTAAMTADGSFVIAWVSGGNQDGDGNGIYAQRFNASGVKQGSEFRVNTFTTNGQDLPAIAIDSSGNFTVTWESNLQDGSFKGVYAQSYRADGNAIGSEFRVNTTTTNDQKAPAIAMRASTGDFVVAWEGQSGPDTSGAVVQRYTNSNIAPINTVPATQTTIGSYGWVFSTARGNAIQVSDSDSAGATERVTLSATNGTLTLAQTAGLSFLAGDGSADATMTFDGTIAAINAALDGMSFSATGFFTGAASVQIVTNDLGNTGAGGALTDTDTVTVNVVDEGTPYIISGSYIGNGLDNRAITGLGFTPDVIILKARDDGDVAVIRTSTMAGDFTKEMNGNTALLANEIQSLDANGFTVGTNATVNRNGKTYDWIAFKASSGFLTLGTYTGDGAAARTVTGVGFSPDALFVFDGINQEAVFTNSAAGGNSFNFNNQTSVGVITALGADGFTVGSDSRVNASGHTYYYLAWNATPGLMSVGSYTGNNTDNRNITGIGFQPEWVVTKNTAGDGVIQHFDAQGAATDSSSFFTGNSAGTNRIQQLLADGFQVGDDTDVNANNKTYTYMAFRQETTPTISNVADQSTNEDTASGAIAFTVGDTETAAGSLSVVAKSSNQSIVSNANIVISGSGANRTVTITPNTNQYGTVTITLKVGDGYAAAYDTFVLTINPVSDAPAGADKTVTVLEDVTYTFTTADFGFTDPSDAAGPGGANALFGVKIGTLPGAGSLTLSGVAVTAGQIVSAANITAGNLKYTPVANANGAGYAAFTFQVQDDGGTANGGADLDPSPNTITINVTAVNDAPAGADKTVTTLEDTDYVFTAADFGFTDPIDSPANALAAVKITTLPGAGTLKLSGVAVTAGQFVSVASIAGGSLKFTPAANTNGAGYTSFTFQVQDDGGTANGGVDLDQSPNTITVNVTAVNDAPAGTSKTVTTLEDTDYVFTAADFGFSDPNDSPANALAFVKITTLPGAGALKLSGVAVTSGQFVSAASIAAGNLKFTPAANANGAGYTSFTFQVQDDGGTANGGVDLDQSPNTITVNVTAVNDAPAGTDKTVSTLENTDYVFTTADFGFADPNDSPANTLANVKITTLPGAGGLTLSGAAVTSGQFISAAAIAAGNLKFSPAVNANGAGYASFTFQVQDNGGTANSGVDIDQSPNTITVNVTSVNNAPAGTDKTVTTLEDTVYTFTAADFGFTDPNDSPANALAAVKITTLPGAGALKLSGVSVTSGQFISAANIAAGNLKFTPAANANGAGYTSFTFQVQDDGGTASGGVDLDQSPNTITVNVTAVNDAPAGTSKTVTTLEDTDYVFTTADFGFSDPNDSPANALAFVKITTLPGAGALKLSGVAVTSGQFVSAANIASGNLKFTPATNANGAGYTSFTFQVQDDGGTANGGVDIDQSANTITVNVTAVNDAPAGTDKTVTTIENTDYVFTTTDFGFTDPSDAPANALLNVRITTVPGAGSLTLSGVAVSSGQFISAASIAAGNLRFTPAAFANGTGYASFTFQVRDDGGTANGGVDLDASPNTITVNVTSVNNAPAAGTDKTVTTLEDTAYTFTAADFGFTDPNDSPANALAAVKITTLPGAGTLKNNGINVTAGQFITVADINAGRLVFTPAPNANGAGYASFTFQVQDDGGTADGGVDLDPSPNTITVNVTPVNDEPEGTSKTITTLEDTPYTLTAADFGYTDPLDTPANAFLAVKITTLPGAGTLKNNGINVVAGQFISIADVNAGKLVYTPGVNANGAGYAAFTFLMQDDGGTANGGVDLDDSPETVTFNVTSVNDAPEGTSKTVATDEDTPYVFTASDFGFTDPHDSPANALNAVRITTLPGAGTLKDNGIVVTTGQLISLSDINTGKLVFIAAADANGAGYASFTFQVQDNGGTANGGVNLDGSPETITIDVTPVNDAPVNSVPPAQDTLKNTPITLSSIGGNAISVSDIDAGGSTIRITLSVTNGTLTLAGTSGLTFLAGDGTSNVTFDGTIANINAALNGLLYDPTHDWSGVETLTITTDDLGNTGAGGAMSTTNSVTINVAHTNSAPVLTGANDLATINEDQSPNTGTLVSALIASKVTDVDDGALPGIAVTAVDNTYGTWQYSTNGGSSWMAFGAVDATSARLLAADANTYVRFVPAADWHGIVGSGITFQAWDQTTGVAGGTGNATVNDGTTAFSAASASGSITVSSVNDAPTGTDNLVTTNEDTPYTFSAADFGFNDPNDTPANALLAVKITTLPGAGTLQDNAVNVTAGQFVSIADIIAGKLVYTPPTNANGVPYTSFTFQVQDDGGTANGGVDLDTVARTMAISVKTVNDAPVGTASTVTTLEDTSYTFAAADFGFTDPNDTPANALIAVKITTLPGAGALTNDGAAVTAGQTVSLADILAGKLVFTPAANANGAGYASFTFQVQDGGGTLLGGVDVDTTPRTLTVNVTPVNDEPVRSAGSANNLTVAEDSGLSSLGLGGLAYAPGGGADEAGQTFTYTVTAVPAASLGDIVLADGTTVVAPGTYTLAEIRGMQFRTAASGNGGPAVFSFTITDSGGTANGGDDSLTESLTVTVAPVNDAPVRTAGNVDNLTVLEDSGLTSLGLGGLAYSPGGNADESGQDLTFTVTAVPPAALGSIVLADGTTVVGLGTYSLADLQGMQFRTAADAHGGPVVFSFTVSDDGGTGLGGADQLVESLTVVVQSVNDAAAGTDKTVTTDENAAYTFTAADFGFADVHDAPANAFASVEITTLPGAGTLTNDGVAVTAGQLVSIADINTGKLVFTAAAGANGAGYASFTFQVQDDGGTTNGGVDLDQSPNTITIDVTSINDAPTGADKTVTTLEDTVYTFTAADFGFSDPNDAPANAFAAVKITTLPGAGTLTNDGVNVLAGQFVSIADINAGKLIFSPAANANGGTYATFTFQVQDDGGTANGGVDLDASPNTITVNVTPVNDAPAGTDKTVTTLEDTAYTFTAADFGFTDASDSPANALAGVSIVTLPGAGALTNDGVNVTGGQFVTIADILAGKLVFAPAAGADGAGYASFTFQVQDDGGTANGGVDLDASPNTITVNVTPVNDAPAGTDKTVTTLEDTAYTFTAADFGFTDASDSPANALAGVSIVTLPGAGALTNDGVNVTGGQFVTIADILAGKLVFAPAAGADGAGYASFTFQVQDDGGTANGGVDIDASPNTITVNVTTVNDAPAGADSTVTTLEDTAYTFSAADFGFTDPDDSPANALAAVKITTIPGAGTLTNNGSAVSAGQVVTVADIIGGRLVFTAATNANGAGYASFTFQVQDDGGTANGGVDLDASPNTITIDVTSVNDEPAGTDKTVTTLEDTAYTFTAADFGFTDPNDNPPNALANVRITTLPGAGTLTNNGVAVTAGQSVAVADINAGKLLFIPAANANGAGYASFTFQVQGDGGTANGGVNTDQSPNTITIDVTPVNDAPAGADKTVTTLEDTSYTFTAADFGFTDAADAASTSGADVLANVKITTLPGAGTLTNNGAAVSAGQFVTIADIMAGRLVFTPAANGAGPAYTSFTFQVEDDGGTALGGVDLDASPNTITIDVTSANDAPAGANTTVTTLEDTAYTFTAADFGFTDPNDSPANAFIAVKITTLPGAGTLTNDGFNVTAGQCISIADLNAGKLVFTPAANANGAGYASFTFQVQDNGGTALGGVDLDQSPNTITFNVTSVNDAPAGADKTVTTLEDTSYTFTATDFGFTDVVDAGSTAGANAFANIRITTLPGAGTLTNNGVAVTAGQFVTIADIMAGNLVFTAGANANGAGYASFTFEMQDDGGTANGGVDLDASPNTITIDVTSVNNAPAGTDRTVTTLEDTAYTFTAADFGFTDPNDSPANALAAVKITAIPGAGTLTNNGVAVSAGQFVTIADILAGKLVFNPAANANGAGYASFTFQVQDDGGTAGGGFDLDASPNTITIDVTSVNDAPAGADKTVTTLENTGYVFTAADFGFSDAIDAASIAGADALANVRITTLPGAGALMNNGINVVAGQFVAIADILAGKLVFTPAANANGAGYASFTFQVEDDGGSANGGIDLDASANTITVNVTSVNNAPAGTDRTVTTLEDTAYIFTAADFGFTDPNDTPANAFVAVKITALPGAGTLTNNGIAVTGGQLVTVADIVAGNLVFTSAANANGTGYASFTFQVEDDGGTANGGLDLDASPNTITVNVTSVDDEPAGADKTVTTRENTGYVFTAADFGFSDAIDAASAAGADTLTAVRITTLPGAGALTNNGVNVVAGQFVTVADIIAGKLVFTPAASANGAGYASFTFQVEDDGGTVNGGVDLDASANTITIDVISANDAPAGADKTVTTLEDTAYTFSAADFGFTDPNDTPANAFVAVKITTLPGAGTLTNNGIAVSAGQLVTVADIMAGRLVFTPAANANGAGYASFTFQVRDDGGTANGGLDLDQSPNTITVNVTPVNDAPAGTDKTVTTLEDTAYTFTATDFGFTDAVDAASAAGADALANVRITTLPGAGTLANNGIAVTAGQAVTIVDILAGRLVFTPAANANGAGYASFTFQVQDDGGTALGGIDLDASRNTITINVNPANDAPVVTNAGLTLNEGQTVTLSGANIGVTDPDSASFTYTVSGVTGGYFQLTTAPGVAVTTFTSADLAGNRIQFVDDGNESAPAFSVTVNDGTASSNTLAAAITYNPVNDAPVVTDVALAATEGQATVLSGASIGVTDPDNASLTYTVSGVSGGHFELTSAPGTAITAFTSAELAGNRVQFVHDGHEAAPTFSVRVSDGMASSNTLAATIAYTTVNDAANGAPSVAGQLTSGQTLAASTAGIADPDGLGAFAFQWERSSNSGASWTGIADSTASTYTLGAGDIGNVVRVKVSYTDGQGTTERLASGATTTIVGASTSQGPKTAPPPPPPPPAPAPAPVTEAPHQEQAQAANPGDARAAQQAIVGGRTGTQGARTGVDTVDATAQAVIVRTSAATAATGTAAAAGSTAASDSDIGRYQKGLVSRGSESVGPAVLIRIDTGAQQAMAGQSEFLGVANGARLEPSVAAIASEASKGEEAAPERATIMTAETSVKLSGAVVSAGFVIWALRGVGLLTTLLSSIPAWRHIDPVPILAPEDDKPDWDDSDDQESAREERAMSSVFGSTDAATDRRRQ